MNEITRQDIISDDALQAPLILQKNFEALLTTIDKVISKGKEHGQNISIAQSTTKLKEETTALTLEQKELIKVQNQIATSVARNNNEYIQQQKELKKIRDELKDKIKFDNIDHKSVTDQNVSIKQLTLSLGANRAAYAALRSDTERNSKEGKTLLKVIQDQDASIKKLNGSMGNHRDNVGDYEGAIKRASGSFIGLRNDLKGAKDEMVLLSSTLGKSSKEYQAAASRAGVLNEEMKDITESTKTLTGGPLERMGNSFGFITGKLKTLDFKGASIGVKQFTAASKEVTFKQAIDGVGGFTKGIVAMGRALLTNPIFLIAVLLIGVAVAVYKLKDSIKPLSIAFDVVGDAIDFVVQKGKDFLDWLGLTTFKLDDATKKNVSRYKKDLEAIEKRYAREISLAEAAGKSTEELEKEKQRAIMRTTDLALLELENQKKNGSKLNDDQLKELEEFNDQYQAAELELKLIDVKSAQERSDLYKKSAEERKKIINDLRDAFDKDVEKSLESANKQLENEEKALDDLYDKKIEALLNFKSEELKILVKAEQDNAIELLKSTDLTEKQRLSIISDSEKAIGKIYDDAIQQQIDKLFDIIKTIKLTKKDELEIFKKIEVLKQQLSDQTYNKEKEIIEKTAALKRKELEDIVSAYQGVADQIGNLFQSITSNRIQAIDEEEASLKESFDRQILMAGDNTARRSELENQFALKQEELRKRRIKEERKAAIFDKALGIMQAIVNVALAVTKHIAFPPLAIAVGIAGALQVATIAAQKIPQYFKGTLDHKGGPAIVGEKGSELQIDPMGRLSLTPGQATLMNLPAHTSIIPHDQTMKALAYAGVKTSEIGRGVNSTSDLSRKLTELNNTIKNKRETHISITRSGAQMMYKNAQTYNYFLNEVYK